MRDIVGFTLAETAFVLLFAVFAALLAGKTEERRALKQVNGQLWQINRLQQDLNSARQSTAELSCLNYVRVLSRAAQKRGKSRDGSLLQR
jgi:hypothetical protein